MERLAQLREAMADAGLELLALVPGPNLRYLTGLQFHLSERPLLLLVPRRRRPVMVLPELERSRVEALECDLVTYSDAAGPASAFEAAAAGLPPGRLGVEGRSLRFMELELLAQAKIGDERVDASMTLAQLRMRKSAAELTKMERAVALAEAAFREVQPSIRVGMRESELAAVLVQALYRAGSEPELPFAPIVASGPNGAIPHHFPGDRKLAKGDMLIVDWGATCEGYFSDITRTFVVAAEPTQPQIEAHEAVRTASRAARTLAAPGILASEVDAAARNTLDGAGYGELFIHRTGHGLGLEVHEEPYINQNSAVALEPGMTFTVEPGVYIPSLGGIRIEDDVVITRDGSRSLTSLPRGLLVVG
ncbi:MAG: hypothetical protein BEU05_00885 [Marine Group III euryarchaeote CG-Bathy2]|uniref:Peptidase M24 n=2 Tax=Methanobacteriati TaxID=3366610 RepID=A0A1J5STG7_9ARCH|nr:putative M24B family peptidase (pepQ) [uncultured marine group II/III euryarchaeote KM3_185_B03]OIR11283.1 MAG: hypothetical protein BEU05_00885 [Marine Group III euryarchaeote CG-Bathy2]